MAAPRDRRHIIVPGRPTAEEYSPHGRNFGDPDFPQPPNRPAHGKALAKALRDAATQAVQRRRAAGFEVHSATPGLYIQFESRAGVPLNLTSLEDRKQGIELVAVIDRPGEPDGPGVELATVFVPDGKVKHFLSRFEVYSRERAKRKGERRHEAMLDPISGLRLATLRGLFTDQPDTYPTEHESIWWEAWLRRHDGEELSRLLEFAQHQHLEVGERRLQFDTRTVVLIRATPAQLAQSLDVLNDLAEVRRAKETAAVFIDMAPEDQADWAAELLARTVPAENAAPAVCILDTGVTRSHPLIAPSLEPTDCHACDPAWGAHDHHGHGTEMAGLALYGDLTPVLAGNTPIELRHRLESVKILPPAGANPPQLYGAITADATGRVEIAAPERRRVFSMAVTATDERDRGQPTSWSAAIDALAAGRSFDSTTQGLVYLDDGEESVRRLFVVSAGNVDGASLQVAHLDRSDADPVHDPGQAWNALTVGAYTDKGLVQHQDWDGWEAVAPAGELSPWSTTGVTFADAWPLKPDVVLEGGNVVKNGHDEIDHPCPDVCLLSTHFQPARSNFVLSAATSAATAQAAGLAARISADYPDFWPETIRGLIVHSAEWTAKMKERLGGAGGKRARARLVRRYGFGVPSLARAIRSANDALTLVAQGTIRPFRDGAMRELHLHELPWPRDVLLGLGEASVRLRVTLSYFVEPNPARLGWKLRHKYASHGLRFDVKGPTESVDQFRKRVNKKALGNDEKKPLTGGGNSAEWYLGEQARDRGSIHSDILQGFAADLAERGTVAVYPIGGWWKELPKKDRSELGVRYALILSIETIGIEADIWTPVAQAVGVPIAVEG